MTQTVLILGGSYAGLHITHHLLKHHPSDLKVILVSANSHFYWNMASVRAVVPEASIPDTQLFAPLSTILARYPSSSYELIISTATASDFTSKTITLSDSRTIPYDHLVIATGSRTASSPANSHPTPWKASGSYDSVLSLLHDLTTKVSAASHIVVAGAGATGCELAGELAFDNPQRQTRKEIVLLAADADVLGGDSIAGSVGGELRKLGVQVRTDSRVETVRDGEGGQTEVVLVGGERIVTDLYLPTMGLVPNTEFVGGEFKDEGGRVLVDECFNVKGAEGVWAAGDVVGRPRCGFLITQKQAGGVAKNIGAVLKGKQPAVVKGMPFDIFTCATGRSRAAGRMGAVKMLSIMAWAGKGRYLGLNYMAGYVDGSVA
ncbi:FAD/NAD(P)-binding domain-containing protein [Coniochaeta ligniaria NRRL 30616]|uniref:FAD/NAD(P)-binding domain-containing protein n=1 Tax=Coniochaeta ligniaria NRRL 30616 TaxID=1408157 RepID=A0A1J7ILL6_9PEZI|nr:FAD/NAD(P)-binding domain-containing protein [Coniochaeta ligniaria NRRL 30616]